MISRGELLDSPALDWLLYLSESCSLRFSIVIEITQRADYTAIDSVKHLRGLVDYAPRLLSLEHLNEDEFLRGYDRNKAIVNQLILGIGAKFAPELRNRGAQIGQTLWDWTRGNWKAIHHVMAVFDEELGPDQENPRLITHVVFEQVEERLMKIKEQWGDLLEPVPTLKKPLPETRPQYPPKPGPY